MRYFVMFKVALATLGCKVNYYETEGIREKLALYGHEIVPFSAEADVYIINTCTVTAKTDYQSRQLVRKAHAQNPASAIIVTGCYAQTSPHVFSSLPGVRLVAGTDEKRRIPDMVSGLFQSKQKIVVSDIAAKNTFSSLSVTNFSEHTRAYLKIQDGCNAFCSYCIIPFARGPSRSLHPDAVIEAVRTLQKSGYREVILTGIHLGLYGVDLDYSHDLASLIRRIEADTLLERLRISSIEPMEISDRLIDAVSSSSILCRHLHVPLQSADDYILSRMKRTYTVNEFRTQIDKIIKKIPDVAIGADVIAGFPGEGEREFQNTFSFIESLPLAYLHVFPYSKRPGTRAAAMPDQVDETTKKRRAAALRSLGSQKKYTFISRFIGNRMSVLIEGNTAKDRKLMKGFSDNYIQVLVTNGDESLINSIASVHAEHVSGERLLGRIV
ncbi:MAG: tRNA (N(6)-L-threonylcarbamoyladenosine(37)-C(2))-methylthiotransferase MtaB [Syntrophales bacterium]|nr:tRNA (N(6)-L-threonylcarbamoyladenosine(37)-C(2))-methylthiotransferase MtaB [Syntrophales bacterium]MDY0044021.1 tRNA (N(6)-L-threonylcarbamoyladenosine(37)-C(2))-methylthiotransferase MtaB [Syntrophales bacterium]